MKATPAKLMKQVKTWQEELMTLQAHEQKSTTFQASMSECLDDVRPEFDVGEYLKSSEELRLNIINAKHALNKFNCEHNLPGLGMTIDMGLIELPMLKKRLSRLQALRDHLPKERVSRAFGAEKEPTYEYLNVEPALISNMYEEVRRRIEGIQIAIDEVNTTCTIEY